MSRAEYQFRFAMNVFAAIALFGIVVFVCLGQWNDVARQTGIFYSARVLALGLADEVWSLRLTRKRVVTVDYGDMSPEGREALIAAIDRAMAARLGRVWMGGSVKR